MAFVNKSFGPLICEQEWVTIGWHTGLRVINAGDHLQSNNLKQAVSRSMIRYDCVISLSEGKEENYFVVQAEESSIEDGVASGLNCPLEDIEQWLWPKYLSTDTISSYKPHAVKLEVLFYSLFDQESQFSTSIPVNNLDKRITINPAPTLLP